MKLYIRYPDEKGIHDLGADEVTIETSEFLNSEVNW